MTSLISKSSRLADIRLSALTPATLSKSDFNTELMLRNLSEHLFYRTTLMTASASQKAICILFDTWITFEENLKEEVNKTSKTIGLLQKLQNISLRAALITIYKASAWLHCDKAYNNTFLEKIELIQYDPGFALTKATMRTWKENLCQELGLESFQQPWWYRKLCTFCKI